MNARHQPERAECDRALARVTGVGARYLETARRPAVGKATRCRPQRIAIFALS